MNDLKTEYENIHELEGSSVKQIERLGHQKERQLSELMEQMIVSNQNDVRRQVQKLRKQSMPRKQEILGKMYKESEKVSERMTNLNMDYEEAIILREKVKAFEKYLSLKIQKIEADRCIEQWGSHEPVFDVYQDGLTNRICEKCRTILPLDSLDHSYLDREVKREYDGYEKPVIKLLEKIL